MNDDTKKRILTRRARLVAAALTAAACEPAQPAACLEPVVLPPDPDAQRSNEAEPVPCLSPMLASDLDAGPTQTDAGAAEAGAQPSKADGGPAPVPCLSPLPNPPPRVCLSIQKKK